jgi:bifunctional N-acetylglutamate synthase/kinase
MEAEIIQRFLESVGQKADVNLYLRLFRAQEKESFVLIAADAQIVRTALDPFHFDLRILAGLGLCPVVLLGLFDAKDGDRQATRVYDWLVEDAVPARILSSSRGAEGVTASAVRELVHGGTIPLVSLEAARDTTIDGRFDVLSVLTSRLGTRKVVFLSATPGLEREGLPHISDVNITTDYERLLGTKGQLAPRHHTLLRQAKHLLDEVPHRMNIAVVSPLALLRELFTVSGAGTLIRRGARVESRSTFEHVDVPRLRALIESAFGRMLRPEALERGVERIFIEEHYCGAALFTPSPAGPYLSKFAVERTAQGEGIGRDIWNVMVREYPRFFWRARPDNPITPWYARQCDGLARFEHWHVFWCNLPPDGIPAAIDYALVQPVDFEAASEREA